MSHDSPSFKVDRTALTVIDLRDNHQDRYWWSRSPEERIEAIEIYRQMAYGYGPTAPRLQRVFEIVDREAGE